MSENIDYNDPETMRRLYIDEEKSSIEIADMCELSTGASVRYWLEKFDIERRTPTEARRVEYVRYQTGRRGYEYWKAWNRGDTKKVYVHRLLAVAEYGIDAVSDSEIHHKNEIKWDNRPENIELMDTSEHRRHHVHDNLLK